MHLKMVTMILMHLQVQGGSQAFYVGATQLQATYTCIYTNTIGYLHLHFTSALLETYTSTAGYIGLALTLALLAFTLTLELALCFAGYWKLSSATFVLLPLHNVSGFVTHRVSSTGHYKAPAASFCSAHPHLVGNKQ